MDIVSKISRTRKCRVLRTDQLIQIDIHKLVLDDHWSRIIGTNELKLSPERIGQDHYVVLYVNNIRQPSCCWRLSSQPIRGRLQNGGFIPWDRAEIFYAVGHNGKRYRFLYALTTDIDTRDELGIKQAYNRLSKKQRKRYREIKYLF
jgi:hypothetical protein